MKNNSIQQNMAKDFDRWNTEKKRLDAGKSSVDYHEREIWWCSIGVNVGSEQLSQTDNFSRPVIIIRRFTREIFWDIPLTTKIKEHVPFRIMFMMGVQANDALLLQMRAYDRRRLVRKIGVMPEEAFAVLTAAIVDAVKTTNPACAGSSEAEANVYGEGYTNLSRKSMDRKQGVDKPKTSKKTP